MPRITDDFHSLSDVAWYGLVWLGLLPGYC
jgi:hypothetical protein